MKKALILAIVVAVFCFFPPFFENTNQPRATAIEDVEGPDFRPNDWFYRQRIFPFGEIREGVYERALAQASGMRAAPAAKKAAPWELLGPTNVGGRITDLEMTPGGTLFAGAASGGLFRSNDLGASWTPLLDHIPNPSIGDIAIAPSDPEVIYVGTGEPNGGGGSITYGGSGIYKSTDGGDSWTSLGLRETFMTGRIAVHPTDPDTVYVGAMGRLFSPNEERGIYRSRNGGLNWEKVFYIGDMTGCIDLLIHPQQPEILFAAMWERQRIHSDRRYGGPTSGIFRSEDGGDTWAQLQAGLPENFGAVGRIGIAIAASNPDVLYAIYADHIGFFRGIFKTVNGGLTWFRTEDRVLNDLYSSFGWWFGNIRVHPQDPDRVYALGLRLRASHDGGQSWAAPGNSNQVHVDQHALCFQPGNPDLMVLGNDGGVYYANTDPPVWIKTDGLPITQFYACEIDPQMPDRVYGGSQDNGTVFTNDASPGNWQFFFGGDGMMMLVDPTDSNCVYAQSQYGNLLHFESRRPVPANVPPLTQERRNWNMPIALDSEDPKIVYFGAQGIYRNTTSIQDFFPISLDLTNGPGPALTPNPELSQFGTVSTISVAPSDRNVIYAGTDDGNLWISKNWGGSWQKISDQLPQRWVTSVAIHPQQPLTAYVSLSGFRWDDYIPHILKTENGGQTWEDVSGNLPETPVNDVIVGEDPNHSLYAATDVGVFASRDSGKTWQTLGSGMPLVPVLDIDLHEPTRTLVAATYGRSMYRIDLDAALPPDPVLGSGLPYLFYLPEIQMGEGADTRVGVANPTGEDAVVEVVGFSSDGDALSVSEVLAQLPPFGKAWLGIAELFPETHDRVVWIQVGSDRRLEVFAELQRASVRSAYRAATGLEKKSYMPHVAADTGNFQTVLSGINGTESGVRQTIRSGQSGPESLVHEHYLPYGQVRRDVRDYFGPDLSGVPFAVMENDSQSAAFMEYFVTLPERSRMASLGLTGQSGEVLHFLHIAADNQQFWTGLVYINVAGFPVQVEERYFGADGSELAMRGLILDPEAKITHLLDQSGSETVPQGAHWMEVRADGHLMGYELFGSTIPSGQDFFAGLQGVFGGGSELCFPHFQVSQTEWTGLVAVNLGDQSADISFSVYDSEGRELETRTLSEVGPKTKVVRLANSFFQREETLLSGAWILARATGSQWAGFLLWGDQNQGPRQHMSGINAGIR